MIIFARVAHTRYLFKIVFQGLAGFSPAFSVLPIFSPAEGFFLFRWIKLYHGKESPLKRKFGKNNYLLNQKKNFYVFYSK